MTLSTFNTDIDDKFTCVICFGKGNNTMKAVFKRSHKSKRKKKNENENNILETLTQSCNHMYCTNCFLQYLKHSTSLTYNCVVPECSGRDFIVYALIWVKNRNKLIYIQLCEYIIKTTKLVGEFAINPISVYDKSYSTYISETNSKAVPCPNCFHLIEKTSGCNCMNCICGFNFCYCCALPYRYCRNNIISPIIMEIPRCKLCFHNHDESMCPIKICGRCQKPGHVYKNCVKEHISVAVVVEENEKLKNKQNQFCKTTIYPTIDITTRKKTPNTSLLNEELYDLKLEEWDKYYEIEEFI